MAKLKSTCYAQTGNTSWTFLFRWLNKQANEKKKQLNGINGNVFLAKWNQDQSSAEEQNEAREEKKNEKIWEIAH